jgi:hypothetical protein
MEKQIMITDSYRHYALDESEDYVDCNPMMPAQAARTARFCDRLQCRVPGSRTRVPDPLVAAIFEDLEALQHIDMQHSTDADAYEDVLVNDLARHLDALLAQRRERLLVGTKTVEHGDAQDLVAVFLIVPQSVDYARASVSLHR